MNNMESKANEVAGLLKGLASHHRIKVLCVLADGEKSVTELMTATGIAQTSMSQHLHKLRNENIVDYRREHRTLYYSITNDVVRQLLDVLHKNYCSPSPNKRRKKEN